MRLLTLFLIALAFTGALALKNEAVEYGFRSDTFLWSADKAYFIIR